MSARPTVLQAGGTTDRRVRPNGDSSVSMAALALREADSDGDASHCFLRCGTTTTPRPMVCRQKQSTNVQRPIAWPQEHACNETSEEMHIRAPPGRQPRPTHRSILIAPHGPSQQAVLDSIRAFAHGAHTRRRPYRVQCSHDGADSRLPSTRQNTDGPSERPCGQPHRSNRAAGQSSSSGESRAIISFPIRGPDEKVEEGAS